MIIQHRMTAVEWALLLFLSVLWGGAYFFNGIAAQALPTFVIVTARVGFGALTLFVILRVMGQHLPRDPRIWRMFLTMGLLNNVIPFSFIAWGQAHIASGVASILNATTPLFTVLVAHWLTSDEKLTVARIVGVIVGLVGVAIMVGGEAIEALGFGVFGQLACLAAALSYAFAAVYGRRFAKAGIQPLAGATGQVIGSTLIMIPMMLIVDHPWKLPMPSLDVIGALAGLAVLSTGLGYIVYFRLIATAGATNASLVTMLIPASAILLGVLILGESIAITHFIGLMLIAAGLAILDGRPWRFVKGKAV
ncbi:MAG: DMT family transporter [Alphaproteobacteria bacterium]